MKSIFAILACLALAAGSAFAFDGDFGVTLDSSSFLSSGVTDSTYSSVYRAAVWGELFQSTSKGGSLDLIAQGSYRYTAERPYIVDLDLLRFTGLFSQAFGEGTAVELKAGRFNFSDETRLILDQTLDGVQVSFLFSGFQVRLAGAYSGLILNPSSNVRISADDWLEVTDNSVFFGPKRIIAQAFIGSDGFGVQALAQFDMRSGATETVNTQYLGIAGVPRLSPNFYLDYHLTASYGQSTKTGGTTNLLMALGGFGLKFYAEDLAASRAHAQVTYATGFTPVVLLLNNYSVTDFLPISQPTLGLAFSPQLSNILSLDAGFSLRPFFRNPSTVLSSIEPLVGARVYFRDPVPLLVTGTPEAILSLNDFNTGSTALYLGTEIEAGVRARFFSDLGLSIRGGAFLPNSSAFSSNRGVGYVLKIDASAAL